MKRRTVLLGALGLPTAAGFLSACANMSQDQVAEYIREIAVGVTGIVDKLRAVTVVKIPEDVLNRAQDAVNTIEANADQIGHAVANDEADAVQHVADAIDTLNSLLSPYFPQAPSVADVVQAALSLLPIILNLVGKPVPASATKPKYSEAQARQILLRHGE